MYSQLDWGEIELRARNNYRDWGRDINIAHTNISQAINDIVDDFRLQNAEKINVLANEMVAEN